MRPAVWEALSLDGVRLATSYYTPDADEHNAITQGEERAREFPPDILAAGHMAAFNLLAALHVPYEWYGLGPDRNVYDFVTGSWVRFERQARRAVQGGPRRIWDEIESLFEEWCRLGCPNRERFGLTVRVDGTHTLWLDGPNSEHRWDVTPEPGRGRRTVDGAGRAHHAAVAGPRGGMRWSWTPASPVLGRLSSRYAAPPAGPRWRAPTTWLGSAPTAPATT